MPIDFDKLPVRKRGEWSQKSEFWIINALRDLIWFLRLFSVPAWIAPFLQFNRDGVKRTHSTLSELYSVVSIVISGALLFSYDYSASVIYIVWPVLVIVDIIGYQFRTLILRPEFSPSFVHYSAGRRLIILMIHYVHIAIVFAILFLVNFPDFSMVGFGSLVALEFSIVSITTVGFGNVVPHPGTVSSLLAAFESLLGVFFLGMAIASAVGTLNIKAQDQGEGG